MRGRYAFALAALLLPGAAMAQVTEANFTGNTTGDLVATCSAAPNDPLFVAAVNFCHGVAVGVVDALTEVQKAHPRAQLICLPAQRPTRNAAVASFVAWAKAHPDKMGSAPSEGIVAFLNDTYPCPAAPAAARRGRRS